MTTAAREASPTYCYIGGQRVDLNPVPGYVAVKLNDERENLSPEALALVEDRSSFVDFVPQYGVKILQTADQGQALEVLRREPGVLFANPVFQRDPRDPDDLMFVDNRFIVQFKPDKTRAQIDEFNSRYGVRIVEQRKYAEKLYVLEAPPGTDAVDLANRYHESGMVESAEPNLIRQPRFRAGASAVVEPETVERATRDDFSAQQWHLDTAKVRDAWRITQGEPDIYVAILDDGVDLSHPEFAGKVVAQHDFENGTADGNPKDDTDRHGTACAGVAVAAGAKASGAAPKCSLVAFRTPRYLGVADEGTMFEEAVTAQADVISCSWGPADGTGSNDPLPNATRLAVRYCQTNGRNGKGIPIFWAAGNGNESVMLDGYASNPDVIAVAASTSKETKAYYSDFGTAISICAPSSGSASQGEKGIFTTDRLGASGYNAGQADRGDAAGDYYNKFGGTSSATPLAAGIAGLMLSVNPNLSAADVKRILQQTADRIGPASSYNSAGHSDIFGYGRVNALAAVRAAQGGGTETAEPTITGPETISRTDPAPMFQVDASPNQYYVVEVATTQGLLNTANSSQWTATNHYGSWEDSPFFTASTYTLPTAVWERLRNGNELYYRVWTSSSNSGWADTVSTEPACMQITAGQSTASGPSISGPQSISAGDSAPSFVVNAAPNQFYVVEVATAQNLLDTGNSGQWTQTNHYGSWEDSPFFSALTYTLPTAVWDRLKGAGQLFYRVWTSSSNSGWVDTATSDTRTMAITGGGSRMMTRDAEKAEGSGERKRGYERPRIFGPDVYDPQRSESPTFLIESDSNRYFAVEVTFVPSLFDRTRNESRRTADLFYGSWESGLIRMTGSSAVYQLPADAWTRLRGTAEAQRQENLFYRVLTAASDNRTWSNAQASTADTEYREARFIKLDPAMGRLGDSLKVRDEALWTEQ